MRTFVAIGALVFSIALPAMASEDASQQTANLNLEGLKQKCAELSQDAQLKPFTVQVTCRQETYMWREAAPSKITLKNDKQVGGSLRMKNFDVSYAAGPQAIDESTAACTVLERWHAVVPAVDVDLSCDELNQVQDISDFCTPIIAERIKEDPSIVTEVKTEVTYDTCKGGLAERQQ